MSLAPSVTDNERPFLYSDATNSSVIPRSASARVIRLWTAPPTLSMSAGFVLGAYPAISAAFVFGSPAITPSTYFSCIVANFPFFFLTHPPPKTLSVRISQKQSEAVRSSQSIWP